MNSDWIEAAAHRIELDSEEWLELPPEEIEKRIADIIRRHAPPQPYLPYPGWVEREECARLCEQTADIVTPDDGHLTEHGIGMRRGLLRAADVIRKSIPSPPSKQETQNAD